MNKLYSKLLLATVLILAEMATPAFAQVSLTSFAPYSENFNALSASTAEQDFNNNTTPTGVYAQAVLNRAVYPASGAPVPCFGNDGAQHPQAGYYSFGAAGSSDRSLGVMASSLLTNGTLVTGNGYVAMRFVNNTGLPIAHLKVSYALEQWYNSGKKTQIGVDYQVMAANSTFSGAMEAGTWTNAPSLNVNAPATARAVGSLNGNAHQSRRVRNANLTNLNLAVGQEVVVRWKFVLNNDTNANGLAIDDVTVRPQAGRSSVGTEYVFYYKGSGALNDLNSWISVGNQHPGSLTARNQTFYITDNDGSGHYHSTFGQLALPGNLISGTNSKLIIGDDVLTSSAVSVAMLTVKSDLIATTIDVANSGTLEIDGKDGLLPTLNDLSPSSTVYYNTSRPDVTISCPVFGNLLLNGNSVKTVTTSISVYGSMGLYSNSILQLGAYDLDVLAGGVAVTDGTAYVSTNGVGELRQTVSNNAWPVMYPVGQAAYNPAWLSQTTTGTEDVFGVSVSDTVFANYTKIKYNSKTLDSGIGQPLPVSKNNANHAWHISEATLGGSNMTMTLLSDLPKDMLPSQAMVGHYHNNAWDDDAAQMGKYQLVNLTKLQYLVTRRGITDFSPFIVNTVPAKALPVTLVAFTATRQGSAVVCNWETATELHNDHFTVERSLDGQTFSALAAVAGAGNSSARHDYRWVDAQPAGKVAYYRLSQADTDGTTTYSPVVAVPGGATSVALTASPNPSTGPLVLTLNAAEPTTISGTMVNAVGAQVLRFEQSVSAGYQAITLDLSAQPAGVYLLRVQTPQGLQTLRVAKQ